MIKATELRIGNWILAGGEPFEVNPDVISVIYNEGGRVEYNQIPLTPELLEKLGVVEIPNILEWVFSFMSMTLTFVWCNDDKYIVRYEGPAGGINHIINAPESLHQLQNLYFALTGQELEINL